MKKIFAVLFLGLFFTSCSNDDSTIYENAETALEVNEIVAEEIYSARGVSLPILYSKCFESVTGTVQANVSGGLSNAVLEFSANIGNDYSRTKKPYVLELHIQQIEDCEDPLSDVGNAEVIPSTVFLSTAYVPVISIPSENLPDYCYKWKVVIHTQDGYSPYCSSSSPWYEAPLF